jgi:hypothetical protein
MIKNNKEIQTNRVYLILKTQINIKVNRYIFQIINKHTM